MHNLYYIRKRCPSPKFITLFGNSCHFDIISIFFHFLNKIIENIVKLWVLFFLDWTESFRFHAYGLNLKFKNHNNDNKSPLPLDV